MKTPPGMHASNHAGPDAILEIALHYELHGVAHRCVRPTGVPPHLRSRRTASAARAQNVRGRSAATIPGGQFPENGCCRGSAGSPWFLVPH